MGLVLYRTWFHAIEYRKRGREKEKMEGQWVTFIEIQPLFLYVFVYAEKLNTHIYARKNSNGLL
jgi:hypothetical protein